MRSMRLAAVVTLVILCSVLVLGCRPKKPPVTVAPPTALEKARSDAQTLRESYRALDANTRVGVVIAVRPEANLVAVGDVPIADFHVGEAVSFIDPAQQTIAIGTVTQVDTEANLLVVRFEPGKINGRAPQQGDLAVRFKM